MEKLISIIVPIYNVEKYLEECLNSIINQTYKNLEIILINDGSIDRSREICEKFEKIDKRITLLNSVNKGAGAAKNIGLDKCSGEYITFVDSDDYIDENMIKVLYENMICTNVEIVQCNLYLLYKDEKIKKKNIYERKIFSAEEFLSMTTKDWSYYVIYNKLYKVDLMKRIRFPENTIIDDEYFTYQVISNAKNILEIPEYMYYYRQRKGSLMHSKEYILQRDKNEIEICKLENRFIKEKFPNILDDFYKKTIDSYVRLGYKYFNNKQMLDEITRYLRRNCVWSVLRLYPFKEKIWILLFLIFPKQICLYNSKNINETYKNIEKYFE